MLSLLLLSLLPLAAAHRGCGGGEIMRRNHAMVDPEGWAKRQTTGAPTDEASAAVSTDINQQCAPYSYQLITSLKPNYPTVWQTATLLPNDTEAQTLFTQINSTLNSKFATDLPRGTNNGNFTGVAYNATDPDCWWTWHQCTTPGADTGLQSDITTVPEPLTWGIGFDDGPNCSHNAFYDFLRDNNQKATMFYIGSNVFDWPLQALRGIADGHQICVHTWSHQYMTSFSNEQAFAELYYSRKAIKDVLGVTPLCWRPPYGDVDNRIRYIAQQLNMSTIVWSDDSEDWKEGVPADNVTAADVTSNYQAVMAKVSNNTYVDHGPIVLTHELTNFTMSEAIMQYPNIQAAFKHIVPICTAYNITQPYAESNITCPDFATYISGQTNTSSTTTQVDGGSSSSSSSASSTSKSGGAGRSVQGGGLTTMMMVGLTAILLL